MKNHPWHLILIGQLAQQEQKAQQELYVIALQTGRVKLPRGGGGTESVTYSLH